MKGHGQHKLFATNLCKTFFKKMETRKSEGLEYREGITKRS
jgi:hypothetical protein